MGVCLENLNRIHTIPSVPIVDCFQKIRQQVKCYHQSAAGQNMSKTELQEVRTVIDARIHTGLYCLSVPRGHDSTVAAK